MSLESNFTVTFKRYYKSKTGTPPELKGSWTARDTTAKGAVLSDQTLNKITEDGKVRIDTFTRLRIRPLTVNTTDRIHIIDTDDIYNIDSAENIDRLGREMVIRMTKMEPGTKAEMGIS